MTMKLHSPNDIAVESSAPSEPAVPVAPGGLYARLATPVDTWVPAAMLAVIAAIVVLGVADRSMSLGMQWYWSSELLNILFTWAVFLGAAGIFRQGSAIAVDALYVSLWPGAQRVLRLLAPAVSLLTALALIRFSLPYLDRIWHHTTPMLGVSEGWRGLAVPVSMALIAIASAMQIVAELRPNAEGGVE